MLSLNQKNTKTNEPPKFEISILLIDQVQEYII